MSTVLISWKSSGSEKAASDAKRIRKPLEDAGDGGNKGSKGLKQFANSMADLNAKSTKWTDIAVGSFAGIAAFEVLKRAGDLIGGTVAAASDLAEAGTAVEEVFGPAYARLDAWASGANRAIGQSKLEALNAAKTFGVYGQSAGLAGEANADWSTTLVQTASDLASFHNADPSDVVEALAAGIRGEAEPLRKYGILLSETAMQQAALNLGISDGKRPLTDQEKILARQAAILAQVGSAQGDFAKTSDGLANQQRIFAASMTNAQAAIGTFFLPILQEAMNWINDNAVPFLERLIDAWNNNEGAMGVARGAFETMHDVVVAVFTWIGEHWDVLKYLAIGIGIVAAVIGVWTVAQWLLNAALTANPIGIIIVGIGLLVGAILWLVANWDTAMAWLGELWSQVAGWFDTYIIQPLRAAFEAVVGWFRDSVINPIISGLESMINWAIDIINGLTGGINAASGWLGIPPIPAIEHVVLQKLATGGDVETGRPYIVGDAGVPELFVPGADGHVFPRVPSMPAPSFEDIADQLPDVELVTGQSGGGQTVIRLEIDGKVLMEWILDEADDAEARK